MYLIIQGFATMPRLFIAIDLPEQIRDEIGDLYCAIKGARWVDENQLHLSLRFIGETDNETESRIIDAMEHVQFEPFTLSVNGTGFFPLRKDPTVLWIGIAACSELMQLQSRIERACDSVSLPADPRNFHPHITIARLNAPQHDRVAQFITEHNNFKTDKFEISDFHLYRSYLGKSGSQYVKEASFSHA